MNAKKNTSERSGIALLVVLIIVMAIAITAMGFLSQSDVELACGRNMLTRTQMDYLAESGLEHAKGLILHPQGVRTAGFNYWRGGTGLQLVSGSTDCYDVRVIQDTNDSSNHCNYNISCDAYRISDTGRVGLSRLHAVLRLDPCIAYWVGGSTTIPSQVSITGDVYCSGALTNSGTINGDVFAATGTTNHGTIKGQINTSSPVAWPDLAAADYAQIYLVFDGNVSANMTGVRYSAANANMPGNVTVNGTLIVGGDLTISGTNNIITTAEPNFPALVVVGKVVMKQGGSLIINGLAQIGQGISLDTEATNASVQVTGGLYIAGGGIQSSITVNVTAAPEIASIETRPASPGVPRRWSPAAGAFFRSIERVR